VSEDKRAGRRLSDGTIAEAKRVADKLAAWPGQSHFIQQMDLDIDDLLAASSARLKAVEAEGRSVRIAVFDYVQLMNMRSIRNDLERIGQVLGRIKAFCVDHQLVGVVASQVTKGSAKNSREGSETLSAEDGQFLRSDKFNLVLTLNPIYTGKALTDQGIVGVAKNSTGDATVQKWLYINPSRFYWQDKEVPEDERITGDVQF
jgi:hypothetical protein